METSQDISPVAWLAFDDYDTIKAISPARREKWIKADPLQQFAAKAYPVAVYAHPDPRIAALEGLTDEVALIRSVLNGYPQSMARADALRAVERIEAALGE